MSEKHEGPRLLAESFSGTFANRKEKNESVWTECTQV